MDLKRLKCFMVAAEELHFGRAAHRLQILPAAFGRHIRLLEEDLGVTLFSRTTRNVELTDGGRVLVREGRKLLQANENLEDVFRNHETFQPTTIRIGAIDSAAVGLVPLLIHDFRTRRSNIIVQLIEDKTSRIIPKLLSGRLDLAFIRPPLKPEMELECKLLLYEPAVVAVSDDHRLADYSSVGIEDIALEALIVPERRSRPHSHDLTMHLFAEAGLEPRIAQIADEKQTIVNLVAAKIGIAIVPTWTSNISIEGVRYIKLISQLGKTSKELPLAVAWMKGVRNSLRDEVCETVEQRIGQFAANC